MTAPLWYVLGLICIADVYRRPLSNWHYADRFRGFWASIGIVLTLLGAGIAFAFLYCVAVLPSLEKNKVGVNDFPLSGAGD